ncbi:MAG: hypothetical protein ACRCW2_13800 [Cellulosilyticaceae bacterium]
MRKIGYGLVGVMLLVGTLATGTYGLSKRNRMIYTEVIALQDEITKLGFKQFELVDYPVSFYDGRKDYVMSGQEDSLVVNERNAVLPVFAGTTYWVDGTYNVIVPTIEKMRSLYQVMASSLSDEEMDQEHVSVVWHEAFHAYQMTRYQRTLEQLLDDPTLEKSEDLQRVIVEAVDRNEEVMQLHEKGMKALKEAASSQNIDQIRKAVLEYKKWEDAKARKLPEEVRALEDYYERVEGTARYVEAYVYQLQHGQDAFERRYIQDVGSDMGGSAKYYTSGMLKCLILDRLDPEWKDDYQFDQSLTALLYSK